MGNNVFSESSHASLNRGETNSRLPSGWRLQTPDIERNYPTLTLVHTTNNPDGTDTKLAIHHHGGTGDQGRERIRQLVRHLIEKEGVHPHEGYQAPEHLERLGSPIRLAEPDSPEADHYGLYERRHDGEYERIPVITSFTWRGATKPTFHDVLTRWRSDPLGHHIAAHYPDLSGKMITDSAVPSYNHMRDYTQPPEDRQWTWDDNPSDASRATRDPNNGIHRDRAIATIVSALHPVMNPGIEPILDRHPELG